jgi:hypothetical protein
VLANSCDSSWILRIRNIFSKPGPDQPVELDSAAEMGNRETKETNVCGEMPKSARVLRMVNR